MKLNILTVLFRKEFLEKQYESIPKKENINWIICKTKEWGKIPEVILKENILKIKIAEVDCEEIRINFIKKINFGFEMIDEGFFYILDDDNIFTNEAYDVFEKYKNLNYEMIIGKQIRPNGQIYLNPEFPRQNFIDMGNVICTTKVLKKVNYFNNINKDDTSYDGQFWIMCKQQIENENVLLINEPIFYYNGLR